VATLVYSPAALARIERTCHDSPSGARPIQSAMAALAAHPLLGRRVEGELRELVISCGPTGHYALYRFLVPRDEVRVLALRTQRELGVLP
jgi:plasmid stabilization system protein ParE